MDMIISTVHLKDHQTLLFKNPPYDLVYKLFHFPFNFVSFQSPKLDFIFEYLDENEFEKKFGEPLEKFL